MGLGTSFRPACSKNPARDFLFFAPAGSPRLENDSHLTKAVLHLWISLRSSCITPWNKRSKLSYLSLLSFPDATSQGQDVTRVVRAAQPCTELRAVISQSS